MSESPRYLLIRSTDKAQAAVYDIAKMNGVAPPRGRLAGLKSNSTRDLDDQSVIIGLMFSPSLKTVTVVGLLIYLLLNFGAYSNFSYLLKYLTMTKQEHIKQHFYFAMYCGKAIGCVTGSFIIERTGRIALMGPGFFIASFFTLMMVDPFRIESDHFSVTAAAINFIGEELVWISFSTYIPEAYPSVIRSVASGYLTGAGHMGAIVSSFFGPTWMNHSVHLPFYLNSAAYAMACLLTCALKKDTAGEALVDEIIESDTLDQKAPPDSATHTI